MLTLDRLKEVLTYDPETGIFRWVKTLGSRARAGEIAGSKPTTVGYGTIRIDGKLYYAHRLAWFFFYGEWPKHQVDHKNLKRVENPIENLREATMQQQRRNEGRRKNNTSGFKGVSWSKRRRKWEARIMVNYRSHVIGYFDTPLQAHTAWREKAAELHGEFARAA